MRKTIECIDGDTHGARFEFSIFHFDGGDDAPSAYIQAGLHAEELPGVVAIDRLVRRLLTAESDGRIRGKVTLIPCCNPIGQSQFLFGDQESRFHLGTRMNFNRAFPLWDTPDSAPAQDSIMSSDMRLKTRLIELAMGHDIVLDLHCDAEALPYLYVPNDLWPAMLDVASAIKVEAVLLWSGDMGASFDEAAFHPHLSASRCDFRISRIAVATVEYRGETDVNDNLAQEDADGLYRLLVGRGVIQDDGLERSRSFDGVVAPIENVEMIRSPVSGAVLFEAELGQRVEAGARLATILHSPGEANGEIEIFAPQNGIVLTRYNRRFVPMGGDLIKLVGRQPSTSAKAGALEA